MSFSKSKNQLFPLFARRKFYYVRMKYTVIKLIAVERNYTQKANNTCTDGYTYILEYIQYIQCVFI